MKQTLSDQRNLTPQVFDNVPWPIANYLWDCLGRSRKRTFYAWKLFATVYPVEFRQISQYHSMKIEGPRLPMQAYLELAKSDSLKWQVVLTLASSFARVPELVEISSIRNLVALEVTTSPQAETPSDDTDTPVTALNDRIIRSWGEMVQASAAFAHLRVLKLCHQNLSGVVLRYLHTFPSLQVIVAYDCPGIHSMFTNSSAMHGWESRPGPKGWAPAVYELYQTSLADTDGCQPPTLSLDSPVLDFQIGEFKQTTKRVPRNVKIVYLYRMEGPGRTPAEKSALHVPTKRPREGVSTLGEPQRRPGPKRAVMKDRKAKDLGDILGDFF
ncbi:hypothetical protein BBP40_003738 [Aspergillus hancockii]|nr:hypothetical protein BBP40_003738 [Aspergillus hancockii]